MSTSLFIMKSTVIFKMQFKEKNKLKRALEKKKMDLIVKTNPLFRDLYDEI